MNMLGLCRGVFHRLSQPLRMASAASFVPKAYQGVELARAELDSAQGWVAVEWMDGTHGRFVFPWLRENAPAEHTYNLSNINKSRSFLLKDLEPGRGPTEMSWSREGIRLVWEGGRCADYGAEWLRARNMADPNIRAQRANQLYACAEYESWGSEAGAERVSWAKLLDDASTEAWEVLLRRGLLVVTEMPPGPGRLAELCHRLGCHHSTYYGQFFQVKPKLASNLAYTTKALGLHTDLPLLSEPPQIQALHCIQQSIKGGRNIFADGFRVAEALLTERPHVHRLLSRQRFEYLDWTVDEGRWHYMANAWPVLKHDERGRLEGVYHANHSRSWFLDAPPEDHKDIYEALCTFNDYCYQRRHLLRLKLKDGEMALFANNRVLHGREETGPDRHYEGCYFTFDAVRSRIRTSREAAGTAFHASY